MSTTQKPSVCRIVQYTLNEQDAIAINDRRTYSPQGAIGNRAEAGDVYPLLITRVNEDDEPSINGHVFLDGPETVWVSSIREGDSQGQFAWPART